MKRPPRQRAILIFVVAIAVRLLHLWQIRRAPFFGVLMGDARGYDAWAMRIAGGDWIGTDVFYQAPLYPYFLGVIYTIAGHSLLVLRVCQAIVGASACVLLGGAVSRLVGRNAGLVAGLALALYAPAIFFDGLIQKSVLDVFFVCLALWLMSRIVAPLALAPATVAPDLKVGPTYVRNLFVLGLAMGGLALTRENAMVLIAVIALWIVIEASRRLRSLAAFVVGLAIVLGPVAARNYAVGGGFYITTSQFGSNFYIGNNPRADGTYMSLRYGRGAPEYERQDAAELAEHALGRSLTPSEVSSFWTDRAMAFVTSQPGAWLKLLGRKFLLLWNADEMLDTESQESYAEWSIPLRVLSFVGHFGVLAPLAVFGAWMAWPERRRLWVFYLMTVAYAGSVILFYVFARYRFPLVPFLILFASAGVASLRARPEGRAYAPAAMPSRGRAEPRRGITESSRRGWGPGANEKKLIGLAAAVAMAVFANWPILSKPMMRAITENNLGTAFQENGGLDDAVAHYRQSIALKSDYAPAYNNLGTALRARGQVDEAVASYQQALSVQPDYPDAHYNLANALLEKNKPEEAAEHFREALKSIPGSAGTHNNLGIALATEGKLAEAVLEFQAAIAAEPDSARSHRNLGNALSSMGRGQEAIEHLRRAVALDPKDAAAHYDLASELLQTSQFADAAAEFRAAIAIDPRSAEAHNNLGITLASMDSVDEAILEFQQALSIQPDYAEAERNLSIARAQKKSR